MSRLLYRGTSLTIATISLSFYDVSQYNGITAIGFNAILLLCNQQYSLTQIFIADFNYDVSTILPMNGFKSA